MSGSTPFVTKNTLGLLTIDWNSNQVFEEEEKSPEVLAIEQAAREAIAVRRKKKKRDKKSKSRSPTRKQPTEDAEKEAKRKAEEEAKAARHKKEEEGEAARLKLEAEARRLKEEEETRQKEEEARLLKEKEEARLMKENEDNARRLAEQQAEDLAKSDYEDMDESIKLREEPKKARGKQGRRISCFPCTPDNDGLVQAINKYGNDGAPFEWEKPEWTMNFGSLKHAETQRRTYGWERPIWTLRFGLRRRNSFSDRRSSGFKPAWMRGFMLKSTPYGNAVRQGISLELPPTEHSFSNSFASLSNSKNIAWEAPEWASNPRLKTTEVGTVVRQGANLALPITKIKDFVTTQQDSLRDNQNNASCGSGLGDSFASMDVSQKNIGWERPSWATNPGLRRTSKGEKMKTTGTLSKPITFPKGKQV